mmetsp:Transcript_6739/g.11880  ORF Transcript_6739/g.11880 Transcript_6739/m.11880 type:complete len:95 (+) Transcript_6739:621-905(+)
MKHFNVFTSITNIVLQPGRARITFLGKSDAERAGRSLNARELEGRPMRFEILSSNDAARSENNRGQTNRGPAKAPKKNLNDASTKASNRPNKRK